MTDPAPHFYQAIATVQGELVLDGAHPLLVTNGVHLYRLCLENRSQKASSWSQAPEADTEAKAKAKPVAGPKPPAVARPEQSTEAGKGQAKAEAGVKPKKVKGLLDGVQLR